MSLRQRLSNLYSQYIAQVDVTAGSVGEVHKPANGTSTAHLHRLPRGPLDASPLRDDAEDVLIWLVVCGCRRSQPNLQGVTPAMVAASFGDVATLRVLALVHPRVRGCITAGRVSLAAGDDLTSHGPSPSATVAAELRCESPAAWAVRVACGTPPSLSNGIGDDGRGACGGCGGTCARELCGADCRRSCWWAGCRICAAGHVFSPLGESVAEMCQRVDATGRTPRQYAAAVAGTTSAAAVAVAGDYAGCVDLLAQLEAAALAASTELPVSAGDTVEAPTGGGDEEWGGDSEYEYGVGSSDEESA